MNKKIIALLVVVAIATTSVFAFGIGGMYSNVTGGNGGALTFGLDRSGPYFGVGIDNNGINVSAEYQLWRYDFVKSDVIDIGFHAGAGANVAVDLFNGAFGLGAGAYGLAGLHFEIDVDAFAKKVLGIVELIKRDDVTPTAKNEALHTIIEKIIYQKAEGNLAIYFHDI